MDSLFYIFQTLFLQNWKQIFILDPTVNVALVKKSQQQIIIPFVSLANKRTALN